MPYEFQRKMRSLNCIKKWKATQYRFFLLYCGPIVLLNILDANRFKNFLLFHVASRILCNDNLIEKHQQHAKIYLQSFFFKLTKPVFKNTIHMHCAIHAADDAIAMGCNFSRISVFSFENFLGKLTSLIRTPFRPLAQICRRLHELNKIKPPKPEIPYRVQILKSVGCTVLKVKCKKCILTNKSPNNFVMLKDNSLLRIKKITRTLKSVEIECNPWRIKRSLFLYIQAIPRIYICGNWKINQARRYLFTIFIM